LNNDCTVIQRICKCSALTVIRRRVNRKLKKERGYVMTSKQRAEKVHEEYRQIVMRPQGGKEKTLVQLIAAEIDDAIKADRKARKK
jgi:hypothetical protein